MADRRAPTREEWRDRGYSETYVIHAEGRSLANGWSVVMVRLGRASEPVAVGYSVASEPGERATVEQALHALAEALAGTDGTVVVRGPDPATEADRG